MNSKEIVASFGLLNSIEGNQISHKCNTDVGSSGSPILLLTNGSVIRVHSKGSHYGLNCNFGILLI